MDENNPYEDDVQPIQVSLDSIKNSSGPVAQSLEDLEKAGQVGITWNEWLECVQWLSIRYTSGSDIPSEWSEITLRAMFSDLQYWTYKDVQKAIVKLHSEGMFKAPNSGQIIGMLNKLGINQVMSQQALKRAKHGKKDGDCQAGGDHEWFELGWLHDEYGDPQFVMSCGKRPHITAEACGAEYYANPAPKHHMYAKPEPMWLEKFVETSQKIGLPDHKIDWILSNARPNLMTYAQYLKKYNPINEEPAVEGEIV